MNYYPKDGFPGFRPGSPDTSREAAEHMSDAAATREKAALTFIAAQGPHGATADETAEAHEWERYSSRPRLATLHARGSIVDSGRRRKGVSGRNQAVWVLPIYAPAPSDEAGHA